MARTPKAKPRLTYNVLDATGKPLGQILAGTDEEAIKIARPNHKEAHWVAPGVPGRPAGLVKVPGNGK